MTRSAAPEFVMRRSSWLLFLVVAGFLVRAVGALAVDRVMAGRPGHDLFPDTEIYWYLGHAIRTGRPFSVPQPGGLHHALRTPGYPLFLAFMQTLFGNLILPIRLIQAALGASTVAMAAGLVGQMRDGRRVALLAAGLVAFEPYGAAISVVLLSEAIFIPLMMLGLWGLAALWNDPARRRRGWIAAGTGLAMGAAILVKPSWALFPPLALTAWLLASRRKPAVISAGIVVGGVVLIMMPWWVRNAAIYGRFVPTALWAGASLYDGLNPRATGASDMEFLNRPPFRDLDEVRQDRALTHASLTFVRQQPRRAWSLGLVKFLRYWSPWPNEASFRSTGAVIAGAAVEVPLFLLMAVGVWIVRRDVLALTILAGPIVYFLLIHMVFVSSVRYRIPGSVPAMGLAATALGTLIRRIRIRLL
jgi:4-amino-4-deoxy-L-arabinose transferase-like glycosyltransferase